MTSMHEIETQTEKELRAWWRAHKATLTGEGYPGWMATENAFIEDSLEAVVDNIVDWARSAPEDREVNFEFDESYYFNPAARDPLHWDGSAKLAAMVQDVIGRGE